MQNRKRWNLKAEQSRNPFLDIPANGGDGSVFMEPRCLCGKAGR